MKKIYLLIGMACLFANELEVDGDLKLEGSLIFQDETSMNTVTKLPSGVIFPFAGQTAPDGYLLCAGQEGSRTEFIELFATIGELYGAGDGSTTFNLPDLRGRIPLGKDNMNNISADRIVNEQADSLGGNAGTENHTLTIDELASHSHVVNNIMGYSTQFSGVGGNYPNASPSPDPSTTTTSGGNQPHNNMPPYLTLNYIIKY